MPMPYAGVKLTTVSESRRFSGQPAKVPGTQFLTEQPRVVLPLDNDEGIPGRVLGGHKPRRLETVIPPADLQALALAQGVKGQADV
jgi:hypothetical protein